LSTDTPSFAERVGVDGVALILYIQGALGALAFGLALVLYAMGPFIVLAVERPPPSEIAAIGAMTLFMCLFLLAIAVVFVGPYFLAGWALRRRKPWAHIVALIMSAISLSNCPFGVIGGVIGLIVLLDSNVIAELKNAPQKLDRGLKE